jgi:trimethylamine--corrinoid protein Co-methyltransferase
MREVGHKGSFLGTKHTVRHFRTEDYMPSEVIDRDYRQTWLGKGALDVNARAHHRVEELIEAYEPMPLANDVVRELEAVATRHAKDAGLDQLPELSAQ